MHALIVEGELYMAEAIRDGLGLEAIAADMAVGGDTGLELLSINNFGTAQTCGDPPIMATVPGVGYCIEAQPDPEPKGDKHG